ncbi:hypothetical protein [Telmatospirillum siberiense]|uniref:Uncharacterized protein n=1 Tax=Telmatospirillum siberiense TaxID=382514 RepID=A0A2N3PV99_9PROT|nr:hypothetical protein [Telmatospirillum siberiense]PKU24325.1 hypothetical protein CWS72_12075 [Telmatospirillum siberiense]
MATQGVSSTRTSGVTVSQTNGNARRSTSGTDGTKAKSSQSRATPRQVINIDGKSFDRYAPRGTYLNIVV